jgi:hypothetical protein
MIEMSNRTQIEFPIVSANDEVVCDGIGNDFESCRGLLDSILDRANVDVVEIIYGISEIEGSILRAKVRSRTAWDGERTTSMFVIWKHKDYKKPKFAMDVTFGEA